MYWEDEGHDHSDSPHEEGAVLQGARADLIAEGGAWEPGIYLSDLPELIKTFVTVTW